MAGIHGRLTRVIIEGADLSGYLREASTQMSAGAMDATPFSAALKEYIEDFPDAKATVSGFYDTSSAGPVRALLPRFGRSVYTRFVVSPEGHGVGKLSEAFSGILTSYSPSRSVGDIQALQLDTQIVGQLFVMANVFHFGTDVLTPSVTNYENQCTVDLPAPYNVASQSGILYFMVKNTNTAALTFNVKTGASSPAASTVITSGSLAAGDVYVGTAGTKNVPITIPDFIRVETSGTPASGVEIPVYVGLVDTDLSLLAG